MLTKPGKAPRQEPDGRTSGIGGTLCSREVERAGRCVDKDMGAVEYRLYFMKGKNF
ncbi:MAG: hypothetical protein ACLTNO_06760 [Blautia sp.]